MKTLVVALLVTLALQACCVPSMAAKPQSSDVAIVSCSMGAVLSAMSVDVEAFWNGRRRRRFLREAARVIGKK